MTSSHQPILIIGAGISGLALAQACRKEGLPYRIFERDESPTSRSAGWGITLNSGLPHFKSLVPQDILARLSEATVDTEAVGAGVKGEFPFFDLSTGEIKWKIPATTERLRISRNRLRGLLLLGVDVEWGRTITNVVRDEAGIQAYFSGGTSASGSFLVACDGAHAMVRSMIHKGESKNYELPVRFLGAGVAYTESQVAATRNLDPYFFHGSDPRTDAFLYFSFLEAPGDYGAPEKNDDGERMYRLQIVISWPYREGFFGRADSSDVPNTQVERLSWMKSLSAEWVEPFRSLVQNLPQDCEVKPVELSDWVPKKNVENVFDGRVVLLGDAFHPMVMYRGQGANESIIDVAKLMGLIRPVYQEAVPPADLDKKFREVVQSYETEAVPRTELAVLASRQACLDAHDSKRLNDQSPLLRRQFVKEDLADTRQ